MCGVRKTNNEMGESTQPVCDCFPLTPESSLICAAFVTNVTITSEGVRWPGGVALKLARNTKKLRCSVTNLSESISPA